MQRQWVLVCVVLLVTAGLASANLLTNPGFEDSASLTGWTQLGQEDWYLGTGADAHTGTNGLAYYVPSGKSAGDYYIALQSVAVTGGESYDASTWLRAVSFNSSEAFLEVVFQDNTGAWIGQSLTTSATGVTDYNQYTLSALVAPVSAVTAMVRAVVHTTDVTTDNAWYTFDDFSFDAVPEPGTLAMCVMGIGFGSILMHRRRRNG